jgi:hypothetical protein
MTTTDQILQQRGAIYGDFFEGITLESNVLNEICVRYESHHGESLPMEYYLFFSKIVMKLSRLAITPDHIDSWVDIAGYARLVEIHLTTLQGENNAKSQQRSDAESTEDAHGNQVSQETGSDKLHEPTRKYQRKDSGSTIDT